MDKYILFYVYGDKEDVPCIIKNPPENLHALLVEWNALDAQGDSTPGWDYVDNWLKSKGVEVITPDEAITLVQ